MTGDSVDLDELRRLSEAATPGPWVVQVPGANDPGAGTVFIDTHAYEDGPYPVVAPSYPIREYDANLIVAVVNYVRDFAIEGGADSVSDREAAVRVLAVHEHVPHDDCDIEDGATVGIPHAEMFLDYLDANPEAKAALAAWACTRLHWVSDLIAEAKADATPSVDALATAIHESEGHHWHRNPFGHAPDHVDRERAIRLHHALAATQGPGEGSGGPDLAEAYEQGRADAFEIAANRQPDPAALRAALDGLLRGIAHDAVDHHGPWSDFLAGKIVAARAALSAAAPASKETTP